MTHRIKFKLQNIYARCVIFIFCILKLFYYNTARRTNAEWFCCESTIKRLSAFVLPVGKTGLPRRDKSRLAMTRFKFRLPEIIASITVGGKPSLQASLQLHRPKQHIFFNCSNFVADFGGFFKTQVLGGFVHFFF